MTNIISNAVLHVLLVTNHSWGDNSGFLSSPPFQHSYQHFSKWEPERPAFTNGQWILPQRFVTNQFHVREATYLGFNLNGTNRIQYLNDIVFTNWSVVTTQSWGKL